MTSTQTPDTQQEDAPAAEGTRSDEPRLSTADISGAQRPPGQVEPKTDHAAKPEAEPTKAPNANIKGAAPRSSPTLRRRSCATVGPTCRPDSWTSPERRSSRRMRS